MRIRIPDKYRTPLKPLENVDYIYAGGFIRDLLMKREPKDIDIAVNCSIEHIAGLLRKKAYIINERFNTARFTVNNINIDVNRIDGDVISDIMRRDFTVNAIASDRAGQLIDPAHGIDDIEKRILRPVSGRIFTDDPLRMLRAYRISYSHELKFARGLKKLILNNAEKIYDVSNERIGTELMMLLGSVGRSDVFRQMHESGLLLALFPELNETAHYRHRKYKSAFLLGHLLNTVEAVDSMYSEKLPQRMKKYAQDHPVELYLSALFHDIEKPACMREIEKGLSFAGHDIKGARHTKEILKERLRLSNTVTDTIGTLISMHMRPHLLVEDSNVKRKGFYRLIKDAGEHFDGLILLSMADQYASLGIMDKRYLKLHSNVLSIARSIEKKHIKIISGNDLMKRFNLKQGPLIGKLLESANDYAVSNKISDKDTILDFVKELLDKDSL